MSAEHRKKADGHIPGIVPSGARGRCTLSLTDNDSAQRYDHSSLHASSNNGHGGQPAGLYTGAPTCLFSCHNQTE